MFVFHVVHIEDCMGPRETHDLGLYAHWADALEAAKAAMSPYLDEDGGKHYSRPDVCVDEHGLVKSASWNDGADSWHIDRREVK